MSFNAIRENEILATISGFTVVQKLEPNVKDCYMHIYIRTIRIFNCGSGTRLGGLAGHVIIIMTKKKLFFT